MKINLWITHRGECTDCGAEFLVHGDPRPKDRVNCPCCNNKMTVGQICGEYRGDDKPQTMEVYPL